MRLRYSVGAELFSKTEIMTEASGVIDAVFTESLSETYPEKLYRETGDSLTFL
ncbi:hypothetical protein L1S32_04900 [Methanogenium sp. S4BF]|uniref:hypothetical protein n=1 Tax=Methanogenium sp. S4BF TaxID=1789226 RepID=UPI0024177B22|nr:hypothetical protein [Methanogenium sp. S4BF]WFN35451.1 hypothetical protein L1S32_04900 [Methanogenium sp. S4BF]